MKIMGELKERKMPVKALKHVKGSELPPSLLLKMEANINTTFTIIPELNLDKGSILPTISVSEQKKRLDNISLDYDPDASNELIKIITESRKNTDSIPFE
jgi:hypothetical protein